MQVLPGDDLAGRDDPSGRMPRGIPRVSRGILFRATAQTLRTIAADPEHLGAEIGFVAVLHTWDETLGPHPHLHCVVPGGGLSHDGTRWIACRPGFFLPVRVLSRLFRRLFLRYLEEAFDTGRLRFGGTLSTLTERRAFVAHLAHARETEWVVYAKPPFGGPQQVLDYVGRYTHRVAISGNGNLKRDPCGHVKRDPPVSSVCCQLLTSFLEDGPRLSGQDWC